jgi:hypothetical protein
MNIDERAEPYIAHSPSPAPTASAGPAEAPRAAGESPSDYVDRIRRYVCGTLPASAFRGAPTLQPAQCSGLLDAAAAEFAPWLRKAGKTVPEIVGTTPSQLATVMNHMQCPPDRLTMSSEAILDNILTLARDVIVRRVPGDFIEAGAWRGGVGVLMRAAIAAHGDREPSRRTVWVADSFAGLPEPDPAICLEDAVLHHLMRAIGGLQVDRAVLERAFARVGLLDRQVRILDGWFADTLPKAPIKRLALMRLDGDWYESTMTALDSLYPLLSVGGFVIIDDYGLPTGCARAVHEYRAVRGIAAPLQRVDRRAVFWCKTR